MQKKAAEIKSSVILTGFSFGKIERFTLAIKKGLVKLPSPFFIIREGMILLDLTFFEFNVFTDDWVVLFKYKFFSQVTRVFLRDVEITCVRSRIQANFHSGWFSH